MSSPLVPIQFTHLKTENSKELCEFTSKKFARLNKFSSSITGIHVTFSVNKLRHIAEANVVVPQTTIHADAESEDMYKTVDLLVDKLMRQLARYKEKASQRSH